MNKKYLFILFTITAIIIAIYSSNPSSINFTEILLPVYNNPLILLGIFSAILLQFSGHWLRAYKHKMLLNQIRPVNSLEVFKGQTIGSLFNLILPFRLGELFRANYVAKGVSISRSAVFATILFERLIDTAVLAISGIILLTTISQNNDYLLRITFILSTACLLLGISLFLARSQQSWILKTVYYVSSIFNEKIKNQIRLIAWSMIYALKNTINRSIIKSYLSMTIAMWLLYISSTLLLIYSLFSSLGITENIILAFASYFGVSIPSGPAYLGSFQQVFSSISTLSIDILHSSNITLWVWLVLTVPTVLIGLIFLTRPHKIYSKKDSSIVSALKNKLYRDVDITNEFALFLESYFKGGQINRILNSEELANNFQVIKTFTGGSNALTLLVWQENKMIVKKITLKQFETKLSSQYKWLKERENIPEITKVLREYTDNQKYYALDIEYRDEYVPFFDIIHSSSSKNNSKILIDVCKLVNKKIYTPISVLDSESGRKLVNDYVKSKVIGKITDSAIVNLPISNLMNYESMIINDHKYKNFNSIIEEILSNDKAINDLSTILESPIHGDLTIDNIIVNPKDNSFILLDPNNENTISDAVVDYGKLMQSIHSGYEFLRSLHSCSIDDNKVKFKEIKSAQYEKLHKELVNYLQSSLGPERYRTILFHEAVHYCRMLTYRVNINPETAAAFYCIAIRLFNEYMEQYKK